jgi:hypothetical protein
LNGRGNRGFGAQLAIGGARPQQNNYRLDGVSVNDYSNGGASRSRGGRALCILCFATKCIASGEKR